MSNKLKKVYLKIALFWCHITLVFIRTLDKALIAIIEKANSLESIGRKLIERGEG